MRTYVPILLFSLIINSCIPIRIAPSIKEDKIIAGRKFRRGLPKKNMFVFEDPKGDVEFYNYVDTKFQLNGDDVDVAVPFYLKNEEYFFSFYEVSIPSKFINLIPVAIDVALVNSGNDTVLDDAHETRMENRYIAIEVFSGKESDCLSEESNSRNTVLQYLRDLRKEYLSTHNYNEVLFKD